MLQKSLKTTRVFALIFMCLLLVSCGKPKPIAMKSEEDINKALQNRYYNINTEGMQYYTPRDLIDYAENGVYPTVTVLDNYNTSSVIFQYAGEDWISMKKITVKTDRHKYRLNCKPSEVSKNESKYSSDVTERVLFKIDRKKYDMLVDMAESKNTSVTFSGDESYSFELTNGNKRIIESFISCVEEE